MAYLGDDFTGSTDALEALTLGGIPTVLFTQSPTEEILRRWPTVRAVGLASTSRAMPPDEMDANLPAMFKSLRRLQPKFVHYKTCSTFDSAPQVGSIGRAIDIGFSVFQNRFVPVVVGAAALGRHLVFGNMFARSGLASAAVSIGSASVNEPPSDHADDRSRSAQFISACKPGGPFHWSMYWPSMPDLPP